MKIGFLGAGNMGGAILRGYKDGAIKNGDGLCVFGVNEEKLKETCRENGARLCRTVEELVEQSDIFFIGVKPGIFGEVMPKVAKGYDREKICVSMAAGISIDFIQSYLGDDAKIVRIMPNTPVQVKEGMTAVSSNANVSGEELDKLMEIFESIGKARIVDEKLMHAVIGVSGSSPAYTYMYIDGLIKGAVKNGMNYEDAKVFAAQAVLGAAKMVMESDISPEELRLRVCSKGGTTIEAVETLENENFEDIILEGFQSAVEKSKKLEK